MKVHYDKDEDILMIVLSDKKIDDAFDTKNGIVEVAEDGEPVILTMFKASKFLKDLGKVVPKQMQDKLWSRNYPVVAHEVKLKKK